MAVAFFPGTAVAVLGFPLAVGGGVFGFFAGGACGIDVPEAGRFFPAVCGGAVEGRFTARAFALNERIKQ